MTIQTAAEHLLEAIAFPPGTVNVLPISTNGEEKLVVWVDTRYSFRAKTMPFSYEGYPVTVEVRPEIVTQITHRL